MRLLYEPQNTVEAHMILNMLEQAGLSGRIDGEHLQSAVGELPAIGLVKVMIEESDYQEAKLIIQDLDKKQPISEPEQQSPIKKKSRFNAGLFGFLCGIAVMAMYYQTPVTDDGIDYNGDGKLDEKWTYVNNRIAKVEIDRNRDGEIDFIYTYDRRGLIESASSDDDFNGTFETDISYKHGNAVWNKVDTTGDGFKNYQADVKHDGMRTVRYFDPDSKKMVKLEQYSPLHIISAKVDTTGDGVLDTEYEYNSIGEIIKTSTKAIKPTR